MKQKKVKKLSSGLYEIYWKNGGSSLASVGQDENGSMWFAPTNWVASIPCFDWSTAKSVVKVPAWYAWDMNKARWEPEEMLLPRREEKIVTTFPCGCRVTIIIEPDSSDTNIFYCAIHYAGPELLARLKNLLTAAIPVAAILGGILNLLPDSIRPVREELRHQISKSENLLLRLEEK